MPFYRSGLQKYCTNESRNKSCKKSMKPQRYWTKDDGVVFMSTEGEGATVLKGHHQQQFSFRDPPLLWVFSWICCFKNFTIGKIRFMNARIQLVHHHTTLMLHHIFELLHKHLHLQNGIKILSSNNHYFSWTKIMKWLSTTTSVKFSQTLMFPIPELYLSNEP